MRNLAIYLPSDSNKPKVIMAFLNFYIKILFYSFILNFGILEHWILNHDL